MSTAITHTTVATGLAQRAHTMAAVCPSAPPGMQNYQDQVIGWVKWGVIAIIVITALVSLGAIGVAVAVIMAILFVTILGVINGVIGSGC